MLVVDTEVYIEPSSQHPFYLYVMSCLPYSVLSLSNQVSPGTVAVAVKSPPEQYCYEQYCCRVLDPVPPRSLFPSTPRDKWCLP